VEICFSPFQPIVPVSNGISNFYYRKKSKIIMDIELLQAMLIPGKRITHSEFGEGVVIEPPREGYVRAFFGSGEKQVAIASVRPQLSRNERIIQGVKGTWERTRQIWLVYQAHSLPLMESAASLTTAKIDLLPHQIVLTHRIATASPRRFLIADEVGLGKTIETALILRELASRGELKRALMVVPAGLVNNWHSELNEVFNLGFEVFGSEGDVSDRKSNAFAKHDRLIASIDSLKMAKRLKKLQDAPHWDLVVFDEAHHLTASKSGSKVRKTQKYKLAEILKNLTRDLLLLSATPHQGDRFRFWMLVQLLNSTLFKNAEDMVEHRHRLNAVMFRRTKADACKPDGSLLFARRQVVTEAFVMSDSERLFYRELRNYLEDGFALAKKQGNQGRALGFVMAIFQKIAASSFAAVRRTLQRRLLTLTIHEGILHDENLNIDKREELYKEAKQLICAENNLGDDAISRSEMDRIFADWKHRILKKIDDVELEIAADGYSSELAADMGEDAAVSVVNLALPEERARLHSLLKYFPEKRETKAEKLLYALGKLWHENPQEKIVIFATYLGTVDLIEREIEAEYPGQGVVVLRGGDHGTKLAAERKFRQKDGPKVLVCTAAGREGINLQFARILFNFDLPWNPMDIEQRIGRIHRYGQNDTAQVYHLVLSDTIEGKIFLLLDEKLKEIAQGVGKVDDYGNISEDFRSQILGQLSEKISYDRLYQEAISDPELKRTTQELATALSNAAEARKVVFELFQDIEGFSIEDYKPLSDVKAGMDRLVRFLISALEDKKQTIKRVDEDIFDIYSENGEKIRRFTTSREIARTRGDVDLMGLDHPLLQQELQRWQNLPPEELGVAIASDDGKSAILTWWLVEIQGNKGEQRFLLKSLAIDPNGKRIPTIEHKGDDILLQTPTLPVLELGDRQRLLKDYLEPMLNRELQHKGLTPSQGGFSNQLIGWVEIQGKTAKNEATQSEEDVEDPTFGKAIRQARKTKGYTLRELACLVNLDYSYLSRLENEKAEYAPSEETIRSLAQVLDLDEEKLIYLVGRIPHNEEDFIKKNYDKIPSLFRLMQENPEFADKIFEEAKQALDP
jgi:superfamily II DNA or RNA helicase/transcriptional regulator with XRE-family HTH domain